MIVQKYINKYTRIAYLIVLDTYICCFLKVLSVVLISYNIYVFFFLFHLVLHPVQCDGCNREAFLGFRYRCQKCYNYQLCQDCFWRGRVSGNHSSQHEMKEYTYYVSYVSLHLKIFLLYLLYSYRSSGFIFRILLIFTYFVLTKML